ncbi:hypothetical protein [Enterobacter wuhouensis]|uniref:hypothetical protein n=1 Tax=Enterobacter wuhouensis TaxID=2529381 RepID=UPI003D78781D
MTRNIINVIMLTINFYTVTVIGNVVRAEQLTFGWDIETSCAISVPPSVDFGTIDISDIKNTTGFMADYNKKLPISVSCSFNPGEYKITLTGGSSSIMGPEGFGCLPMTGADTNYEPALGVCISEDGKAFDVDNYEKTYSPTAEVTEHIFEVKLMANNQNNIIAQKVFSTLNVTLDVL